MPHISSDRPTLQLPDGLDAAAFLARYWQQQPLLMRQGMPGIRPPLAADELAGLACEDDCEARLIQGDTEQGWQLRHGPFDEEDFAALPARAWTLLVQDVDKFVPAAADLLDAFGFIPRWRLDDLMVSYAVAGGSVGPHTDAYDVFLIQVLGHRRWSISRAPVTESDQYNAGGLRLLRSFEAEQSWVLGPGDILYLPPGVAHWGVAEDDCMTCSVGFRAPALQEFFAERCQQLTAGCAPTQRYQDPPGSLSGAGAEIPAAVITTLREQLEALWRAGAADFEPWLGAFLTSGKPHLSVEPPPQRLTTPALRRALPAWGGLARHPFVVIAHLDGADGLLHACAHGDCVALPASARALAQWLSSVRYYPANALAAWLQTPDSAALITRWFNLGYLQEPE